MGLANNKRGELRMIGLHKINPMVRAVGTMGAVAAVAGGITFAALTSNTVALSANTLSSATAHLMIGAADGDTCTAANDSSVSGMNLTLTPGEQSEDFKFCLKNDGDVALDLTSTIPAADLLGSPISGGDVMLDLTCDNEGAATGTLNSYATAKALGMLDAGESTECTATAMLDAEYDGEGTTVKPFTLNFVGTQSESSAPEEPSTPPEEETPVED
jgi:hypothetical protein